MAQSTEHQLKITPKNICMWFILNAIKINHRVSALFSILSRPPPPSLHLSLSVAACKGNQHHNHSTKILTLHCYSNKYSLEVFVAFLTLVSAWLSFFRAPVYVYIWSVHQQWGCALKATPSVLCCFSYGKIPRIYSKNPLTHSVTMLIIIFVF